jgi:hypothetical protein
VHHSDDGLSNSYGKRNISNPRATSWKDWPDLALCKIGILISKFDLAMVRPIFLHETSCRSAACPDRRSRNA